MRKGLTFATITIGMSILASRSYADPIFCNKSQTRCVIRSKQFTIGDKVGILNEHSELVATGRVKAIQGEKRTVSITKRHGMIADSDRIALLGDHDSGGEKIPYKIYREPATYTIGASMDYGFITVADGAPGFALTPYGTWRFRDGFEFVGRGLYSSYNTVITNNSATQAESLAFKMRQLGLLGGVGYRMLESNPISFRGELTLGLNQVSATVDDDPDLSDSTFNKKTKVKNGIGSVARWSIGAYYRINKFLVSLDAVQSITGKALSSGLSLGGAYELD